MLRLWSAVAKQGFTNGDVDLERDCADNLERSDEMIGIGCRGGV